MKTNFNFSPIPADSEPIDAVSLDRMCDAPPGRTVVIASLDPALASTPIGRRLLALGLAPGTRVRVVRRAPLGDPTVYELRGYQLCLRRSEAAGVRVQSQPGEGSGE
jgi:ferrous iron transport protein A